MPRRAAPRAAPPPQLPTLSPLKGDSSQTVFRSIGNSIWGFSWNFVGICFLSELSVQLGVKTHITHPHPNPHPRPHQACTRTCTGTLRSCWRAEWNQPSFISEYYCNLRNPYDPIYPCVFLSENCFRMARRERSKQCLPTAVRISLRCWIYIYIYIYMIARALEEFLCENYACPTWTRTHANTAK